MKRTTLRNNLMRVLAALSLSESSLVLNLYPQKTFLCISCSPTYHCSLSLHKLPGHITVSTLTVFTDPMKSSDQTCIWFILAKIGIVVFVLLSDMTFMENLCKNRYAGCLVILSALKDLSMSDSSIYSSHSTLVKYTPGTRGIFTFKFLETSTCSSHPQTPVMSK